VSEQLIETQVESFIAIRQSIMLVQSFLLPEGSVYYLLEDFILNPLIFFIMKDSRLLTIE